MNRQRQHQQPHSHRRQGSPAQKMGSLMHVVVPCCRQSTPAPFLTARSASAWTASPPGTLHPVPCNLMRGFFLTFEGLDGSGKSTQLRRLATALESLGVPITVTRQPGGTHIGDRIRSLLLDSRTESIAPMTELGLMFSDRAQAIAEVIRPALEAGRVILCDRFTDSTEAYQGGGRQLGSDIVLRLHADLCGGLLPDLTLLLLPDFDRSLKRARRRNDRTAAKGKDEGRFEKENEAFYRRVYDQYRAIAEREPQRVAVIDGDRSIPEIHRQIRSLVEEKLQAAGLLPVPATSVR